MSLVCGEVVMMVVEHRAEVEEVLWGGEPLRGGVNCSSSTM